ncbi:branched-chain amino acid ABC transporter permease [Ornithinimicrobium humiphilum]|uniref:Amino acid/amide ABC transporter membrane protein 2 (HAAT family) n=1 Tax=Ornithinimicrobium humiphilum TaxID=125288 RepID=A0A543KPJ8_9MICO|nr:branched-chain amino acid ABC transporter permease [Ornithinimicrobium humiphilum]TQM96986.1 amino acid/amide ABC transporter membrane protein 2 (HAAT family) [Ornithinimicrobium humiphilum]
MDWGQILNNTASFILSAETIGFMLAAIGLAVHFGYAGLLNFGMAGFMAIGAYGYAISILSFGFPWWAAIGVSIVGAIIFAVILGIPTLRLRADYLAIVTIAAAEIVRLLLQTQLFDEYTNSADGLGGYHESFRAANPLPAGTYGIGPWTYTDQGWWARLFGLLLVALAVLIVWLLMRSPWGRVLKGIREDEDAVRSLGKNVFLYKMQALIIGGVLGALGGVVIALPSAVIPQYYLPSLTFFVWTALLLGGAATIFGPVLGAILYWVLMAFLAGVLPAAANAGYLPISATAAGNLRFVVVGVALMLLVAFRPQGLLGNKKEMTFVK